MVFCCRGGSHKTHNRFNVRAVVFGMGSCCKLSNNDEEPLGIV